VLSAHLGKRAVEGTISPEPLINDDCQGVLVTGRARLALDLLGGHVSNGPGHVICVLVARALGDEGNAKITEQDLVAPS